MSLYRKCTRLPLTRAQLQMPVHLALRWTFKRLRKLLASTQRDSPTGRYLEVAEMRRAMFSSRKFKYIYVFPFVFASWYSIPRGLKTRVKIDGYQSVTAGSSKDKEKAMELKCWMQIDSL